MLELMSMVQDSLKLHLDFHWHGTDSQMEARVVFYLIPLEANKKGLSSYIKSVIREPSPANEGGT